MRIREITLDDLPTIASLLTEGFPSKSILYWQNALAILAERPSVGELPQFGLAIEVDGALQGVMLMIAQSTKENPLCNLSSWYIRPDFRKYAVLLFQRSLRFKNVTYTDCSPASHVLPVIQKFGFVPYTGGTLLLDARIIFKPSQKITILDKAVASQSSFKHVDISKHIDCGCRGFLLSDANGRPTPVLYRVTRLKRLVPAAQFVFGSPKVLLEHAPGLLRALLRDGVPIMLIDWPQGETPTVGKMMPRHNLRYYRGGTKPDAGDLANTEIGLFGL